MDTVMLKRARVEPEVWRACCEDTGLDEDGSYHPDWLADVVTRWRTWKILATRQMKPNVTERIAV
jgi:hypothetical protein